MSDIARRLSEIRYQVERRQTRAVQQHRQEPDFGDLEARIENEWRLLCLRAGFADRGLRPSLPSDTRQLLLSSGQVYNDLIINHSRGTLISPRTQGTALTPITSPSLSPVDLQQQASYPVPVSHQQNLPSSTTANDPATPDIPPYAPDPGQISGLLGDPAIPIHTADLYDSLQAFYWEAY